MKNKIAPLNFTTICSIRTYLTLSVRGEIKARRECQKKLGTEAACSFYNKRIKEMIVAVRASRGIPIV